MTQPRATTARRLSTLSVGMQALLRVCQDINYGQISDLRILDGEPVYDPAPTVLRDIKLDADCTARPESQLDDFELSAEVLRLLRCIEEVGTGRIQRIEVRAGIPRRVLIQMPLAEAAP